MPGWPPRWRGSLPGSRSSASCSSARGTASRRSDIDLFVVWDTPLPPLERIGRILSELRDAPRAVEAIVYTPRELKERGDSRFIRRILAEGKVLHER